MMDETINESDQVSWNFAQQQNMELARLRSLANSQLISLDYRGYAFALVCIRRTANYAFSDTERAELDKLEMQIRISLAEGLKPIPGFGSVELEKKKYQSLGKAYLLLQKYDSFLSDCLDRYKFFGSRKEDTKHI